MAENSSIEWTRHTFNPWSGCTKVSAGCKNCYAEVNYSVKMRGVKWGPQGNRIVASDSMWQTPLKWDRAAAKAGERHRVFCASLADVFEDWQGPMIASTGAKAWVASSGQWMLWGDGDKQPNPECRPLTMQDVRRRLFDLIDATPNLDWLLLTKRPENVNSMMAAVHDRNGLDHHKISRILGSKVANPVALPANVWLGVSVENQQAADERIPELLKVPAEVRFLSCEPLLDDIDIRKYLTWSIDVDPIENGKFIRELTGVHWVIVGGESGPGARPCNVEWVRSIVEQCKAAGVACFVKQVGAKPYEMADNGPAVRSWGDATVLPNGDFVQIHIRDKKGGDINEFPADLRVREFPNPVEA